MRRWSQLETERRGSQETGQTPPSETERRNGKTWLRKDCEQFDSRWQTGCFPAWWCLPPGRPSIFHCAVCKRQAGDWIAFASVCACHVDKYPLNETEYREILFFLLCIWCGLFLVLDSRSEYTNDQSGAAGRCRRFVLEAGLPKFGQDFDLVGTKIKCVAAASLRDVNV